MDGGRQWQLTLQRLRHQAKRIAGDPGESDEDKQRYRSRFKHEFETLVAAELSKLEAATESAFTDAWSASQEADRAKFERDVAVHAEAIRRAASERGDILKDASDALATIESQPGRAEADRGQGAIPEAVPPLTDKAIEWIASPQGQRDRWIYLQRKDGLKNQQVINKLSEICDKRGWETITTHTGVRDAVKRYRLNTGSSELPDTKGGRPPKQTRKS